MSLHIPDKGEQVLIYYGRYSNKNRGLRKKDKRSPSLIPPIEEDLTHYQKQCKSAWARLIRKIYEVGPFSLPQVSSYNEDNRFYWKWYHYSEDTETSWPVGDPLPLATTILYIWRDNLWGWTSLTPLHLSTLSFWSSGKMAEVCLKRTNLINPCQNNQKRSA